MACRTERAGRLSPFVLGYFFRSERYGVADRCKVLPGVAEWCCIVRTLDAQGEIAGVLKQPSLGSKSEFLEFYHYGPDGFEVYELKLVCDLTVTRDIEIVGEHLEILRTEESVRTDGGVIVHRWRAVSDDAVHNVLYGPGHHAKRQVGVFEFPDFLAVVVGLKALQRFCCCTGEASQGFYEKICHITGELVKEVGHFTDHIVVDVAVAGECLGAFAVAGELADEVRVFDLLIKVADEGSSGHVGAGNVAYGVLL